ncbi:MAG: DUF4129 domain-containing protein [Caldilineaceae bacterium]|nr:DUF4129 domain-containing protein [Caldilineaceae bacterium]
MTTSTATPTTTPTGRTFHYINNLYFQDGVLFSSILVGLLYLLVAASLDGAGYVTSMGLLYPVTMGAIAVSLLMAYSRFDSFFAFSHGMFTGLAWILFLMRNLVTETESRSFIEFGFPELQAKVYFVLYRLLKWVELAWSGQAAADNYMFIFEICLLVWWLTYLGIWSIFRHGYTWRAVIPAGVVMLINTYYAPQSVTGLLFIFAFLALILLVRTNLAEQQLRWRYQRTYFSQDITLDFLRTGLLYSFCVMAIAFFAPGLGRSGPVRDVLRPLTEEYVKLSERVTELYPSLVRQVRPTTAAFGRSLTLSGERNVGEEIIFTVATPLGRYWRAVVFDTFDGRQWQNTNDFAVEFDAETILPVPNWQARESITQTIQVLAPTGDVIFGAPDIYWINLPLDAQVSPAPATSITSASAVEETEAPAVEFTYARSRQTLDIGDSYTVLSRQTTVTQNALENAGTDYPALITDKYLQLPEDFSPRIRELAITLTDGLPTAYAKAKAVETYLRTIDYDDAIPAPPQDVDPLEYFLFDLRRGYCDYYASAMATMLRSVGIPARTASGYAEGSYDEESRVFFVTAADAHTWVEVYFPTYGWIEFEPTAGESTLTRPQETDSSTSSEPITTTDTLSNTAPPVDNPMADPLMNPAEENAPLPDWGGAPPSSGAARWPWWVWAILTPLLVLAGFIGLRYVPLWGPTQFTPELPPILYARIQRWTERIGLRLPANETPYEHERRLGQALPEGKPFTRQIVQTYVRYQFGPPTDRTVTFSPAGAPPEEGLGQSWQALERVFWKAWLRKFYDTVLRRRGNPYTLMGK